MNAVITGGTRGIGRAIALKLAAKGYNLSICARDEEALFQLKKDLETMGIQVFVFKADMAVKAEVYAFCEAVKSRMLEVDVLVNNTGNFLTGSLLNERDEQFEQMLHINLNASYYCGKFFGKMMREQRFGHVFNICSVASKQIAENAGSYSVTKAAMFSLSNVFRDELSKYNVKVTAVLPGSTLTSSWEGTSIPEGRFVKPEDIAETIWSVLNLSSGANVDEITIKPVQF
ncbi:MAG: SDR family oxidoreductase [Pedobacter sp.]|nr:SDR family oxidoreductase [Pedobacter sp.]